ncbi:D-galactonate transporter [Aquisphaera giovannonii]|uniref:D-galactonate transporter n=1 Tax=Aquisphaera giovannonii TaxID=406548 RepID=A0A5B9W0F5_9BACT|nr:MFS transporter [Aquisphaera giovannonii]QEH33771.1 D-galactonate transporter [Aquisphaera giovannonii]
MSAGAAEVESEIVAPRAPRWAWGLCWLMFASTVLCYMDRQAMALVGPLIRAEYGLTNESYGWVLAAFSLTYAAFQVPAGQIADRRDVRAVYASAVGWWSAAGLAAAFAPGLGILLACRALLGVGESFNWPCALRVTSRILPPADRGLGSGIFNSGAAVGAVLTPLVVTPLAARYGWRAAFVAVGSIGFLWIVPWLRLSRRLPSPAATEARGAVPADGGRLDSPARLAYALLAIASALVACSASLFGLPAIWWAVATLMVGGLAVARALPPQDAGPAWASSLSRIVRLRRFWVLVAVGVSINLCWHFLVNWLPSYLQDDRKMAFLKGGLVSALPYLAADAGNLLGGGATRGLARRGPGTRRARLAVMAASSVLASFGAWVGWVDNDAVVVALLMIMALGTAAYMANYFSACQEVSAEHTGLVVGVLGGLGNLFVAGFLPVAGRIKDATGGFSPVFVAAGLLPFVGLAAMAWGWGKDSPESPESA